MREFVDAFQVKDSSVFELVHHTFYERDFLFFAHMLAYLAEEVECDPKAVAEFAKLSQLLYLSSLLHFSLTEETNSTAELRAEKQMPVLLGDLLYGRFISALVDTNKVQYLPIYISYLQAFNQNGVDAQEGRKAFTMKDAAYLLMEKTTEVFAAYTGANPLDVLFAGEEFFAEHWHVDQGDVIDSMEALANLMQRNFGQGAMVC